MAKEKTVYVCSNCGQDSPKWVGKCPSCGMWNTYVEEVVRKEVVNKRPVSGIETAKAKLSKFYISTVCLIMASIQVWMW